MSDREQLGAMALSAANVAADFEAMVRPHVSAIEAFKTINSALSASGIVGAVEHFQLQTRDLRAFAEGFAAEKRQVADTISPLLAAARASNSGAKSRSDADPEPTAPKATTQTETPRVQVFVRKGAHDHQRVLSFKRCDGVSSSAVLERGMAVDGNQVVFAISGTKMSADGDDFYWNYAGPFIDGNNGIASLQEALAIAENALVAFLKERGLEADFV